MVDCSKVYISTSTFSTDKNNFLGAFAKVNIKKDELIEYGLVIRVEDKSFNGMNNPHVFTWSDDIPNTTWAFCSGCATFYNTSLEPNTRMDRDFENDTFIIYAIKDIKKDDELTHKYRSLSWRMCFKDLDNSLENSDISDTV